MKIVPGISFRAFRRSALVIVAASATSAVAAPGTDRLAVALGKALFDRVWVPAPSSTKANDGIGPLFNARSCAQCHRKATAGSVELDRNGALLDRGAVVRLSNSEGMPDPHYGAQIQTRSVAQIKPEARIRVAWITETVRLPDNTAIELRRPELSLDERQDGALDANTRAALVVAPSLTVAARIAKTDASIFGRKASDPDIITATARAFSRDLGMSTKLFRAPSGDCTPKQMACLAAPSGAEPGGVEIGDDILEALAAYVESLPAPSAPNEDDREGRAGFEAARCASCHVPEQKDRSGASLPLYSDLRVHDLGEALAGHAEQGGASPTGWRTAPLLALKDRLRAGATLMHDGRARSIEEAILWHGGEAQAAKDQYAALPAASRAAIARFLLGK